MDILVSMQFSELPEMLKGSCLYPGILLLCGHSVFMVNLEMYKAKNNISNLHFCKHNNVGRDRDWIIVVQVFISLP